ncbi:MAG: hypothetical protein ABJC24_05325 [Chloroflexota bacterium]
MRFVVTLSEDGRQIRGDIHIPEALPAGTAFRAAAIARAEASLRDKRRAGEVRRLIAGLIPGLAAQIQQELPPAAPARKVVQTDENSGTLTTSTDVRRAVPPPAIRATEIARRLAPYVAAEKFVTWEAARFVQAARTEVQKLDDRLARLGAMQAADSD